MLSSSLSLSMTVGGFTEVGLSSVIGWMRGIPITMPETILNIGGRALEEPAAKMKAILGYWQGALVTFSGPRTGK